MDIYVDKVSLCYRSFSPTRGAFLHLDNMWKDRLLRCAAIKQCSPKIRISIWNQGILKSIIYH